MAIEAAAVVLMQSDLRGVAVAIDLSRHIFRRIQLNMLFSLGFNTAGIPIAAGALYPLTRERLPPELAALAMALSSVSVVLSSLLLRYYTAPRIHVTGEQRAPSAAGKTTTSPMTSGSKEGASSVELASMKGLNHV